jgi:hypothetical protein
VVEALRSSLGLGRVTDRRSPLERRTSSVRLRTTAIALKISSLIGHGRSLETRHYYGRCKCRWSIRAKGPWSDQPKSDALQRKSPADSVLT